MELERRGEMNNFGKKKVDNISVAAVQWVITINDSLFRNNNKKSVQILKKRTVAAD